MIWNIYSKSANFFLQNLIAKTIEIKHFWKRSNLVKVHSLFSMLGLTRAYVTNIGQLIGVVGLTELSEAIQNANSNKNVEEEESSAIDISKVWISKM